VKHKGAYSEGDVDKTGETLGKGLVESVLGILAAQEKRGELRGENLHHLVAHIRVLELERRKRGACNRYCRQNLHSSRFGQLIPSPGSV